MRCIEMNIGALDVYGRPRLTLTWDVLKCTNNSTIIINSTLININMRCIEMSGTWQRDGAHPWLTLTWDVLKSITEFFQC